MKRIVSIFALLLSSVTHAAATQPAAQPTDFHGYAQENLVVDGCASFIVSPKNTAPGDPWIWRAEFFGNAPQLDLALLARGYHLVYIQVGNTFGAPSAMKHWDAFYKVLTDSRYFSKKPVLEGLSRGGLYCFNWAIANPDHVGAIVSDNAIFDFKSWPAAKGKSKGSKKDWDALIKIYGFKDEAEALAYKGNPIDHLDVLAAHHVPLFFLYADADLDAIPEENSILAMSRYKELGGTYGFFIKHGLPHHPHGLDDPTPIVDFIEKVMATPSKK